MYRAGDQAVGGAATVIGAAVTVQSVSEALGLVGAVLGICLTVGGLLVVRARLRLMKMERDRLDNLNERNGFY